MKLRGNNGLGNILKVTLQVLSVLDILSLLFLYNIIKIFNLHFNWFIALIYPCGLLFAHIMYQFIGLFNSLKENNPFCEANVNRLKKGMTSSFLISIFIFIALLLAIFAYDYYTLQLEVALFLLGVLFIGVGIALYILSELFHEATIYKEENDLTI